MKQLASALDLLNLIHKDNHSKANHITANHITDISSQNNTKPTPQDVKPVESKPSQAKEDPKENQKQTLNKEELRLLVKILKAVGHTCEHNRIDIKNDITHYRLDNITLVFDDVKKGDTSDTLHLSPLTEMQTNPDLKRPTWEKLKNLI